MGTKALSSEEAAGQDIAAYARDLRFVLNGRPIVLREVDPSLLLVDYLRSAEVALTGTKLACGEGGCGACTVALAHWDPIRREAVERPINACLRPLCSVDGMVVTTTEGIGNSRRLNPIQKRIAEYNGSQCGFCTPGFVMSMYSLLRNNPCPSTQDIEDYFDGNLCRCTGYRPILDAMHSFVGDPDGIAAAVGRPLSPNWFGPARNLLFQGQGCTWYRVTSIDQALGLLLRNDGQSVGLVNGNTSTGIYRPTTGVARILIDISQIAELQQYGYEDSDNGLHIGGGMTFASLMAFLNTAIREKPANRTRGLEAMRDHIERIASNQVRSAATVGGNIMLVLDHVVDDDPFPSDLFTVLAALGARVRLRRPETPLTDETYPILELPPASHLSTGCLITSVYIPFTRPDEFVTTYKIARRHQNSHAIVNAGFRVAFGPDNLVENIRLIYGGLGPIARAARETEAVLVGKGWTERTLGEAVSALDWEIGAWNIRMPDEGISIAYRRALALSLFYKFFVHVALDIAPNEVAPRFTEAGRPAARPISRGQHGTIIAPYAELPGAKARAFLPAEPRVQSVEIAPLPVGRAVRREEDVAQRLAESLRSGDTREAAELASAPMIKIGAELQATGEAKYTHDLWPSTPALACHFVLSRRKFAKFDHSPPLSDLVPQLFMRFPGFRGYITYTDIPSPARSNSYDPADPGNYDPVFANGIVTAYGQPIGLVVADTPAAAEQAAAFVEECVVYDTSGLSAPITTIEQAVEAGSFLRGHGSLDSITRLNSDAAWLTDPKPEPGKILITGSQVAGAQAHFYLETQATLAVPEEMGRITLHSSSQHLGTCQEWVANALGIPVAKVNAKALRLGGGFGGKEVRPPYFAVAAAVAAWTLQRPVRLALDRKTDMIMVGKRHPFRGDYVVSADEDGRIDKMKVAFFANAGFSYDCTLPVTDLVLLTADVAYRIPTFRATRTACRTNLQTNTAMRSFGVIQCSLIVEEAIEKIAHQLGIRPETIRERNFYRDATIEDYDYTPYGQALIDCRMNQVWTDFKKVVQFEERVAKVSEFNDANRWRKRGISMIPIKYGISYTYMPMNQGGAEVIVFSNDGTVLIKHGGVEMGQGIHTKIARLAADALGIDLKYIQVSGTDTFDIPNAPSTGASTGTDLNGGAMWQACKQLRERLIEFCKAAKAPPPNWQDQWQAQWPAIIRAAFRERIDLCSQALFASPHLGSVTSDGQLRKDERLFYYFTYSAAVSEVEIDVLTGECSIVRSDLVYDCGKTINAALDYGQIEGAFVQGIGNIMTEEIYFDEAGRLVSHGTWNYKVPCSKTIPVEFNVNLLDYVPMPGAKTPLDTYGIRSAKSTGEPPLVLACSVFFAIKHAILAARAEAGATDWFELQAPATIERIQTACLVSPRDMKLSSGAN